MLLNALTNYLQNQPAGSDLQSQQTSAAATVEKNNTQAGEDTSKALYTVSDRAVMVSAVAAEFNIAALQPDELGRFQNRLQEYGLIDNQGMQALSVIHTARLQENTDKTLNAKAIVEQAYNDALQPGTSYSQRKQIHQLHTLFSNLDSASIHQRAS